LIKQRSLVQPSSPYSSDLLYVLPPASPARPSGWRRTALVVFPPTNSRNETARRTELSSRSLPRPGPAQTCSDLLRPALTCPDLPLPSPSHAAALPPAPCCSSIHPISIHQQIVLRCLPLLYPRPPARHPPGYHFSQPTDPLNLLYCSYSHLVACVPLSRSYRTATSLHSNTRP
jgi:hypothetical protein